MMQLPQYPHLEINLGIGKIPFGTFPFLTAALLGFANAHGTDMGYLTPVMSSGPAVIGAARAAMGTLEGSTKLTVVNYVDPNQEAPRLPERTLSIDKEGDLEKGLKYHDYHSPKESTKRALRVGLIYQLEAAAGFAAGYVVGKLSQ